MTLAIPLRQTQVTAAGTIHDELHGWKAADRVLRYLTETVPGHTDPDQILLKAAVLNELYKTQVFALHAMARHIANVFSSEPRLGDECGLVERIAHLEASGKKHDSFASKYCHFFIDTQRFPLYDKYARGTVRMHLGRGNYRCTTTRQTYRNFYADTATLRASLSFHPTVRELDHYLWLRGQWKAFREGKAIGAEVRDLFERASSGQGGRQLIDGMCARHSPQR